MTKTGKLSNREIETLNRAWDILSKWTDVAENNDAVDEWLYDMAMSAVVGLCEFINSYEG